MRIMSHRTTAKHYYGGAPQNHMLRTHVRSSMADCARFSNHLECWLHPGYAASPCLSNR